MYEGVVEACPWQLKYVLDQYKTQEVCEKAVEKDSSFWGMFQTGLSRGSGHICGMMKMTIGLMMKIVFLSGMKIIKNEMLKKPQ